MIIFYLFGPDDEWLVLSVYATIMSYNVAILLVKIYNSDLYFTGDDHITHTTHTTFTKEEKTIY